MTFRTCTALVLLAGLALPAVAQIRAETSWRLDNTGRFGFNKQGGPAEVYPMDRTIFNTPTAITTHGGRPVEGLTESQQQFNTCSGFGIPLIGGVDRTVLFTAGTRDLRGGPPGVTNDGLGYVIWAANGPDNLGQRPDWTEQYTLGFDMLIPTTIAVGERIPIINDGYGNYNAVDGFFTYNGPGNIVYQYRGAQVPIPVNPGQWFRFFQVTNDTLTSSRNSRIFINGNFIGLTSGEWFYNGINPASPPTNVSPTDWAAWGALPCVFPPYNHDAGGTLFNSNNGVGERFYVANIYFGEGLVCDQAILALGGPTAAAMPRNLSSQCNFPPTVNGSAAPAFGNPGETTTVTAVVTPGIPAAPITSVTIDLTPIGGSNAFALRDDGLGGDPIAGDNRWTGVINVPGTSPRGVFGLNITVTDNQSRSGTASAIYAVNFEGSGVNATAWNFDNPADPLASTCGNSPLSFWDRTIPGNTQSIVQFGTTTSFSIPNIGGSPANVMFVPALFQDEGFRFRTASPGNGGGVYVNNYTMIFDILIPSVGTSNGFMAFWNTNDSNNNVADGWARLSDNAVGLDRLAGPYSNANAISRDTWHRIAFVVSTPRGQQATTRIYVDGAEVVNTTFSDGVDGRWSLYSTTDGSPAEEVVLFTDRQGGTTPPVFTSDSYINSVFYADRTLTAAEIAALGGPTAAGLVCGGAPCPGSGPGACGPGDWNEDGTIDFNDLLAFLNDYNAQTSCADVNGDGAVDFNDLLEFLNRYNAGC
jgi:hypothetical protein